MSFSLSNTAVQVSVRHLEVGVKKIARRGREAAFLKIIKSY